MQFKKLIARQL